MQIQIFEGQIYAQLVTHNALIAAHFFQARSHPVAAARLLQTRSTLDAGVAALLLTQTWS